MRRTHDFYETPPHYLEALFAYIDIPAKSNVLEPCVGEGAISEALKMQFPGIFLNTNDLDRKRTKADSYFDATNGDEWSRTLEDMDWTITNPPFNQIEPIVRNMLHHSDNSVFLARLSFLEPTAERVKIFKKYGDPDMLIVLPRYSFRLNDQGKRATDSVTCAWMGWGVDVPKLTTVWTE